MEFIPVSTCHLPKGKKCNFLPFVTLDEGKTQGWENHPRHNLKYSVKSPP